MCRLLVQASCASFLYAIVYMLEISCAFGRAIAHFFVWGSDTIDWREERSAQTILDTVLPKLHPGCIILCHNNGYKIKEYLPTLIETAQGQGYEFVTISDLLLPGDTIVDVNGVQKPA